MKKLLAILLTFVLVMGLTACGESEVESKVTSTPESVVESEVVESEVVESEVVESEAVESEAVESEAVESEAVESEVITFTLDYDALASWITGGYLGDTSNGAPALLAIDDEATVAIAVFGNNDTMEAVSFLGELVDNGDDTVTITDPESELSLTFGFVDNGDGTYAMDMGEELGLATLTPVELEELLEALKMSIDNYTHIA